MPCYPADHYHVTTTTTTTVECVPHDAPNERCLLDKRTDRPFFNLSQVHRAAEDGRLALAFPVGSLWEYGPFTNDRDPIIVRVTGAPYTSGVNYSAASEDREALDKPCWFIGTEVVYSPFAKTPRSGKPRTGKDGYPPHTLCGYPPHTLCALTPRMALLAVPLTPPLDCLTRPETILKGRIRALEADVDRLLAELDNERKSHKSAIQQERRKRADAEATLLALRTRIKALSSS